MAILDQGPPPPPGVGTPSGPSMSSMAGAPGGSQPDASMQKAVLEKMMLAEKSMQDAATIMPALQPVIQDLIGQFRSRVGAIVLQGQQDQPGAGAQIGSLLGGGVGAPATP